MDNMKYTEVLLIFTIIKYVNGRKQKSQLFEIDYLLPFYIYYNGFEHVNILLYKYMYINNNVINNF